MDFTGIVGLVLGFALIVYGILDSGGSIGKFLDLPSALITIGGTIAAVICSFPVGEFKKLGKYLGIAYGKNRYDPMKYIKTLSEFALDARKKGILSLEDKVQEEKDTFMRKSIMLVVDAMEPGKTKKILEDELDHIEERHENSFKMFEKASGFAPAFGMIGTLVGLVVMLGDLNLDSADGAKKLTDGMAIALITTFYGSVFANLVLSPIANKLRQRHAQEMLCKQIIVEGVLAIQAGDNPRSIEERLYGYLEAGIAAKASGGGGDEAAEGEEGGKKGKKPKKEKQKE